MAQIFIAHSSKDRNLIDFFSRAFAGTKVKAIFEEFEKILTGIVTPAQIAKDIDDSKAVFVILSVNIEHTTWTRDWVVSEHAMGKNRDVWVFEPYSQFGKISIVTPYLKHYVIFDTNDDCLGYIRRIIESYDDSHVLPTVAITGGIGALLAKKDKVGGAVLAGLAGLMISDKSGERPPGKGLICAKCFSSYNIHLPPNMTNFRCPVCNSFLTFKIGQNQKMKKAR